jgi:sterol desaturase/sphingolipid hydroxylase (fatty acid hydroxylase superfamily)
MEAIQHVKSLGAILGFDPLHQENLVAIRCLIAAHGGFWGMSLLCLVLDLFPSMLKWKTQGSRSYFTVTQWCEAAFVSFLNLTVSVFPIARPMNWLWHGGVLYPAASALKEADPWIWWREFGCLLGCILVIDVWFYWTHRLLHYGGLYTLVHKMHHRFTAPTAVAAVYAHPVEFIVGNLAGVVFGPIVTNAHPYTAYAWVALSLVSTCGAHSGYTFFSAAKHDAHHKYFNCNYGVGPICDTLFGTTWVDPKATKVDGKGE